MESNQKTEEALTKKAEPEPAQANHDSAFDRKRHIAGAILGPLCALLIWFTPIAALSPEAHHLLAIMSLVAIW